MTVIGEDESILRRSFDMTRSGNQVDSVDIWARFLFTLYLLAPYIYCECGGVVQCKEICSFMVLQTCRESDQSRCIGYSSSSKVVRTVRYDDMDDR